MPEQDQQDQAREAEETLAQLLDSVGQGDREAFARLYDRTSDRLYGLSLRLLRSSALAEEAVQETYLQVWEGAKSYDRSKGQALSWMLTLCHRRSVDRIRNEEARKERETRYGVQDFTPGTDLSEEVCDRVRADSLRGCLANLPEKQSEALVLVYFEGMTAAEAAIALSLPLPTMKSRVRDGLQSLRKQLRRQDHV